MIPVIREIVEKLCNLWNIRLAVIFSLFLQTLLILLAPSRKHSSSKMLALVIWPAYLLADVVVTYAAGLISHDQCRDSSDDDLDLLAFWSPFLIVHLGGPDTITALALEDNKLWLRHLLTLVFQAAATLYVFLQSLPENKLMIPMILMFVSGCIKYLERIRSLYLASSDRLLDAAPRYVGRLNVQFFLVTSQFDDLQLVHKAYSFFKHFGDGFVHAVLKSRFLFGNITATTALRLIEVELNFIYDVLFTKAMVVQSSMGFFFRFFSFCCLIASLAIFHFHITKHGVFNGINVSVTYALFLSAVALEIIAFLMAVLSDWTVAAMMESKKYSGQNRWRRIVGQVSNFVQPGFVKIWSYWTPRWYLEEGAQPNDQELRRCLLFRRWSGYLSGHNLIRYCLKRQPSGIHNTKSNLCVPIVKAMDWVIDRVGLRDLLNEMTCLSREPLRKNLWDLIFQQLQKKSYIVHEYMELYKASQIASAKGEWVLEQSRLDENLREKLKEFIFVPYDESLLLWHVATELSYNDYRDPANVFSENNSGPQIRIGTNSALDPEGYVEMSKTLSDYMFYLLIMQPDIMPAVGAIGKTSFQDTCTVAKNFFDESKLGPSQQVEACNCILGNLHHAYSSTDGSGISRSVFFKARELAKDLRELEGKKKWEFISQIWVELLCHAAVHSRVRAHKQQLSKGGELITFVWLLMTHFEIGY